MDNKTEIGRLIKSTRESMGWTQTTLAKKSGLTLDVISRMELNKGSIGNGAYNSVAKALNIIISIVITP